MRHDCQKKKLALTIIMSVFFAWLLPVSHGLCQTFVSANVITSDGMVVSSGAVALEKGELHNNVFLAGGAIAADHTAAGDVAAVGNDVDGPVPSQRVEADADIDIGVGCVAVNGVLAGLGFPACASTLAGVVVVRQIADTAVIRVWERGDGVLRGTRITLSIGMSSRNPNTHRNREYREPCQKSLHHESLPIERTQSVFAAAFA